MEFELPKSGEQTFPNQLRDHIFEGADRPAIPVDRIHDVQAAYALITPEEILMQTSEETMRAIGERYFKFGEDLDLAIKPDGDPLSEEIEEARREDGRRGSRKVRLVGTSYKNSERGINDSLK